MLLFAPYPSLAFSPLPSSRRSRAMAVASQRAPCLNLPLAMLLARIPVFDGPCAPTTRERESEKGGGGRERRGKEPIVASLAPACHCRRFPNRPNYWKRDGGKWKGGKREKREVRQKMIWGLIYGFHIYADLVNWTISTSHMLAFNSQQPTIKICGIMIEGYESD